jgi:ATPase subunit of ABC transporter with duplicated ATPase domains
LAELLFFSDVSFAINENDKIALMGKMEQESQRFSRLLLGKANRQQETYLHQRGCGSLPQHLLATESYCYGGSF